MIENNNADYEPQVIADVLLTDYVLKEEDNAIFVLDPKWAENEYFIDMVKGYKIGIILHALLAVENENGDYLQVRLCFEKLVFRDGNVEKLGFYYGIKKAMDRLSELLFVNYNKLNNAEEYNTKLPWVMEALRSDGILGKDQCMAESGRSVIWMGWGKAWLKDIGITEHNPIISFQFAMMWANNYIAIKGCCDKLKPIII